MTETKSYYCQTCGGTNSDGDLEVEHIIKHKPLEWFIEEDNGKRHYFCSEECAEEFATGAEFAKDIEKLEREGKL